MGKVYLLSSSSYLDIPNFNTAVGGNPTNEQRALVANYVWNGDPLVSYEGGCNINSNNVRVICRYNGPYTIAYAFYYAAGSYPMTVKFLRTTYPNTRSIFACAQQNGQDFISYGVYGPNVPNEPYYYDDSYALGGANINNIKVELYNSRDEALAAITPYLWNGGATVNSITYRTTNATHSGPDEAAVGDTVSVNYTFPDGYGIANFSDIYVTNNGVLIPSQYANGTLTFTMPEQS